MLVADASILAPALSDGGADGQRFRQRLRGETIAAPDLAKVEVLSVIRRHLLSGALAQVHADAAVEALRGFPLVTYPSQAYLKRCWDLRGNVTSYDVTYVALAEALRCPLLTADCRLAKAHGTRCEFELV